jgi:hypothetical protein
VFDHFSDVQHILHAGDIGDPAIIVELSAIAPVDAVWGNTDGLAIRSRASEVVDRTLAGRRIIVVHGHQLGAPTPERLATTHTEADIIVFGHTHRPAEERVGRQLILNPGGAGAPRFGLRPSIALLDIDETREEFRLIHL